MIRVQFTEASKRKAGRQCGHRSLTARGGQDLPDHARGGRRRTGPFPSDGGWGRWWSVGSIGVCVPAGGLRRTARHAEARTIQRDGPVGQMRAAALTCCAAAPRAGQRAPMGAPPSARSGMVMMMPADRPRGPPPPPRAVCCGGGRAFRRECQFNSRWDRTHVKATPTPEAAWRAQGHGMPTHR